MQVHKFASLGEIQSLPGYVEHIGEIIQSQEPKFLGYYEFEKFIQCALRGCHHWHGYGYVVEFDDHGGIRVVAIGNVCGAQLFGADRWEAAARSFDKKIARRQLRDSIATLLAALPATLATVDELISGPKGANWYHTAEKSLSQVCPEPVLRTLYDRASKRLDEITEARERDDNDVRLGFNRTSDIVTDVVGRFVGLGALIYPSPRIILVERLRDQLRPFLAKQADDLVDNKTALKRFQKITREIEGQLQLATKRLTDAKLFFTTENLQLIAYLATGHSERRGLARLRWNEQTGRVEIGRST